MTPLKRLGLLLVVLLAAGAHIPTLRAADEPLPAGMEATNHACPRCHRAVAKKTASGVLYCINPDCRGSYFLDKAGHLQPMITVATPEQAEKLLHPRTPNPVDQANAETPLNPEKVGAMFDPKNPGDAGMRAAKPGEAWHPTDFDPNSKNLPKIQTVKTTCPVCAVSLQQPVEGNRNYLAGVDKDFMRHSLGTFAVHAIVWLCPDCGYAALPEEFDKPVSPALRDQILREVKPAMQKQMIDIVRNNTGDPNRDLRPSELAFHEYVDLNDLPDYLKYERAWAVQAMQKKLNPAFAEWDYAIQARVDTEASYACREYLSGTIKNGALVRVPILQRSVQFLRNLLVPRPDLIDNPEAQYANALQVLDDFKNGDLRQPNRPAYETHAFFKFYLMLSKAGLEDRIGRPLDADKSLRDALQAVPSPANFTTAEEKVLLVPVLKQFQSEVQLRMDLLKREQEYLRRAALNGVVALYLGRYPRKDLLPQVYLVAEQMRRVGAIRRSLAWFRCAQRLNADRGPLTAWIEEQVLLKQFENVAPDDQDKLLFAHLEQAFKNKDLQTIPGCPNPPTDFSLAPDAVAPPPATPETDHAAAALAGIRTVPEAMGIFYKALDAHRKLTGSLPGTLDEMVAKGSWKQGDCKELTLKGRTATFGEARLEFVYDAGGISGWGSKSHFLLMPARDNTKAMFVLCGNGDVIDLSPPAKPTPIEAIPR